MAASVFNGVKYLSEVNYCVLTKKLLSLNLFCTNRCNSRCKTCNIWKKKPNEDLSVEVIEMILKDKKITNYTTFSLTGGEFILHPKYREILTLFEEYNRKYILLTNGILADKLIKTVREFKIKNVSISMDGPRATYKDVRGVDNYDNICKIVNELKSSTDIHIHYTINPYNNPSGLKEVVNFCQENNLELSLDVYQNIDYFNVSEKNVSVKSYICLIDTAFKDISNHNFIKMYDLWFNNKIFLPCWSIKVITTILPNGDVLLCQFKNLILGNVYKTELSNIWNSKNSDKLKSNYLNCNSCWLGCQRGFDCNMVWVLNKVIPSVLLKKIVGPYDFNKALRC
ncbi:MAG: radical SAM protein [Thermotogota bacterium]|nr:radical SAM protein [Thermotogota bacterium]